MSQLPELHEKLTVGKVGAKCFFIPHYYTLLTNSCPLDISHKIISTFLVLGEEGIQEILINQLIKVEKQILKMKSPE